MESLQYFFRGEYDGYVFKAFSPLHFAILAVMFLGIGLIVKKADYLRTESGKKYRRLLFTVLLIEQIMQYSWYFLVGTFTLGDSLPLYICRTAILSILLAFATGNRKTETISVYWGLFGGVLASVVPVIYPFSFPHFTNFSYFIGHLFMVWSVTWFIAVEKYRFTRPGLVFILIFTNLFNVGMYFLNPLINGNYSYFTFSPVLWEVFSQMDHRLYASILFILYNLLIFLIHCTGSYFQKPGSRNRKAEIGKPNN